MGYFDGLGDFLGDAVETVGGLSNDISEIKSNWDNFGKTDADLKAEAEAREVARLKYQAQLNQSNFDLAQLSDNKKILMVGGALLAGVLLFSRGD